MVVSNDAGAGTVTTQVDLPGECVAEVCTDGLAAYAGIVDVKMTIDSLTDALDMAQALRDVDPGANVSIKYVNAFTREGVAMYRRDLPSLLLLPALDGIDKGTIKTRVLPLSFSPAEPVIDVVTRDTSRGQVSVSLSTFSDCPEAFLRSADGATEFSDTLSCTGEGGESGTATMSFTESYVGNELIVVTASGSGNATDGATAGSEYSLELTVAQTTQVLIDAEVTGGENSGLLFQFFGPNGAAGGVLLDDRDGGAVNETVTLVPGRYVCIVAAVSGGIPASGAVSFSLGLTFGP